MEKLFYSVYSVFMKLIKKKPNEKVFDTLMQFVKFGIVGLSNTLISYVLYSCCLIAFQRANVFSKMDYLIAQIIAFVTSVLWSFYWNNKMVFTVKEGKKRSLWKALIKTYVSYSFTGLFLNSILLILWVQVFHISEFIAPLINLMFSVPLNFVINKFWSFK